MHFFGQQKDETLRRVVHEHPIFYLHVGLPFLLSLIFLSLVVWIETTNTLPGSVFPVLDLTSGFFIVGSLVYGVEPHYPVKREGGLEKASVYWHAVGYEKPNRADGRVTTILPE